MCEFCVSHGDGEKWYLQAKNYSDDLLSDIKRQKFIKHFTGSSAEEFPKILKDLKSNGSLALTLTGGELFTRSDYKVILDFLCENKFSIKINTNGTYINEDVIQTILGYPQLSHIHVSLYSAYPDVHDTITMVKGSFAKTVRALKLLSETDRIVRINCKSRM